MELICAGCFVNADTAQRSAGHDAAELLVCGLGAVALTEGIPAREALRCSYCGGTVHLDHHHTSWYDQ